MTRELLLEMFPMRLLDADLCVLRSNQYLEYQAIFPIENLPISITQRQRQFEWASDKSSFNLSHLCEANYAPSGYVTTL